MTTAWQCDGDVDCSSGEDEANCDNQPSVIEKKCSNTEFEVSGYHGFVDLK